jgi:VanZ family protein
VEVTRTPTTVLSRLDPWAPPLLLMAAIFVLSAQPDLSSGLGVWDTIGRKVLHMAEYALLCFLWWRALRLVATRRMAIGLAAAAAFLYAVSDEIHQSFVAGRHGTPVDVAIDSVGIAIASLLIARRTC